MRFRRRRGTWQLKHIQTFYTTANLTGSPAVTLVDTAITTSALPFGTDIAGAMLKGMSVGKLRFQTMHTLNAAPPVLSNVLICEALYIDRIQPAAGNTAVIASTPIMAGSRFVMLTNQLLGTFTATGTPGYPRRILWRRQLWLNNLGSAVEQPVTVGPIFNASRAFLRPDEGLFWRVEYGNITTTAYTGSVESSFIAGVPQKVILG